MSSGWETWISTCFEANSGRIAKKIKKISDL